MDEEKAVAVILDILTEAVGFSGETQSLLSLSSPSTLLLDPHIDQTQPRARGQEGLGLQSLKVSFKNKTGWIEKGIEKVKIFCTGKK